MSYNGLFRVKMNEPLSHERYKRNNSILLKGKKPAEKVTVHGYNYRAVWKRQKVWFVSSWVVMRCGGRDEQAEHGGLRIKQ